MAQHTFGIQLTILSVISFHLLWSGLAPLQHTQFSLETSEMIAVQIAVNTRG